MMVAENSNDNSDGGGNCNHEVGGNYNDADGGDQNCKSEMLFVCS